MCPSHDAFAPVILSHGCNRRLPGLCCRWTRISCLIFEVERHPFTTTVLYECNTILIPDNHAIERIDQGRPGACDFIVNRGFTQAPGGVDAPIGATDSSFIMQIETSGYLLILHALRHQFGHAPFA